ncbi:MAG: mannose-6-phosphate isomerase, partial [Bacteroidetes bacterium]
VVNIPAGVVHAIGKGILLAEVQQNSDTTYRVYDYGRTGRPLHIEKALEVINFNSAGRREKYPGLELNLGKGCSKRIVIANHYFCTEVYHVAGKVEEKADGSKFYLYTFTSGKGSIVWDGGELAVDAGESVMIPAAMGMYSLTGEFTALKAYIPELEVDVLKPLRDSGWSMNEMFSEIGGLETA